jgi:hypothetical protein
MSVGAPNWFCSDYRAEFTRGMRLRWPPKGTAARSFQEFGSPVRQLISDAARFERSSAVCPILHSASGGSPASHGICRWSLWPAAKRSGAVRKDRGAKAMAGILSPKDLNKMAAEAEVALFDEERQARKRKETQEAELREAFSSREVHPEAIDRINRAITIAAKQGKNQIQVLTFPATYCNDGGRRINNFDPEWPSSLEGFAKKGYEFFEKELRPLGFKIGAEITSFPNGMPGDVAMFLKW